VSKLFDWYCTYLPVEAVIVNKNLFLTDSSDLTDLSS
jgi:hypothetical protein